MGQFTAARFAWMVPTRNGQVIADDPQEPGAAPIYKVPIEEVDEFIERFTIADFTFVPLYSDVVGYHTPDVVTRRKKNEGSA